MNIEALLKNIERNRMKGYFVQNKEEAIELIKTLIHEGETISNGGSMTAGEIGLMDLLRSGKYNYLDRAKEGNTPEDVQRIYREAFSADTYFASTNAITEDGYLYNVDGNGNRVAAMIFGPKQVIVIAGINKIVKDLAEAELRVKTIAAPKNCVRLDCPTPCKKTGKCASLALDTIECADGCGVDKRICCDYVIMGQQRIADRIKVIIINEELGY